MYALPAGIGPELGDVEVSPAGDQIHLFHLFHLTLPTHDVVQHVVSDDGLAPALPAGSASGPKADWRGSPTRDCPRSSPVSQ